jgi:hypothetical protein
MRDVDRYREQAEYCHHMAQACLSPVHRLDWLALARDCSPASEEFEVMAQYLGTGQVRSGRAH